jgi:hypothetical protein
MSVLSRWIVLCAIWLALMSAKTQADRIVAISNLMPLCAKPSACPIGLMGRWNGVVIDADCKTRHPNPHPDYVGWLTAQIFPEGLGSGWKLFEASSLLSDSVLTTVVYPPGLVTATTTNTLLASEANKVGPNLGIEHNSGPLCAATNPLRPRMSYTINAVNAVCASAGALQFSKVVLQFWDEAFTLPSGDTILSNVLYANFPLSAETRIKSLLTTAALEGYTSIRGGYRALVFTVTELSPVGSGVYASSVFLGLPFGDPQPMDFGAVSGLPTCFDYTSNNGKVVGVPNASAILQAQKNILYALSNNIACA